jgi:hypothetical protein
MQNGQVELGWKRWTFENKGWEDMNWYLDNVVE